jgi:hypothetical protein
LAATQKTNIDNNKTFFISLPPFLVNVNYPSPMKIIFKFYRQYIVTQSLVLRNINVATIKKYILLKQ